MDDPNLNFPMHVGIVVTSAAQLASVYALLSGAALAAVATAPAVSGNVASATSAPTNTAATKPAETPAPDAQPSGDDSTVDAHGWPWSPDLHAATKGTTKDGLWRMKVGVSRPDPKPGFPVETGGTGTPATGTEPAAGNSAGSPSAGSADSDDDEFAAFRAAAAKSDAEDAAAKGSVPPRKWTDADLGALCNQAAVKLGDPAPVKALIGQFVADGEVAHSRNIPEDKRADFAAAVEKKAGIEFAG